MRCFIAILLPDAIHRKIAELQEDLRRCGLKLRWVRPENIHLTLSFLGEIGEEQAGAVTSILEKAAAATSPFDLSIEGIGQFPPKGAPRVVWLGLAQGTPALLDLARRIRDGLKQTDVPFDRKPFHPHLTLARADRGSRGPLRISEKLRSFRAGQMTAQQVDLMKSDLRPTGAEYTSLGRSFFTNAEQGMKDDESSNRPETDQENRIILPRYDHCFVCGSRNPSGLDLQFEVKNGRVETSFIPGEEYCGYRGVVHGGVLTAVLDECMGWTIITRRKALCVGAEITVRFKQRALAGGRLFVSAECVECRPRLMTARGRITDEQGNILCAAHGKFSPLRDEEMKELENYAEWNDALDKVFAQIQSQET